MKQIAKAYDAKKVEDKIYQAWEASGFFNPDNLPDRNDQTYSIALPPPNVTGKLHLGHSVMLAVQDILIRYHRMKGDQTLWLPGTDHAAIATQTVVEKILKKEGTDRHQLGREKFLKRVAEFVDESKGTIHRQIRQMGASLDWSRERYTLDKDLTKAVRTIFKRMYDDGLIYRGYRIVNWCPRCASTLADDEVEYKEEKTKLYTFKYSSDFPFSIATTRPETKVGDTAIAVNLKDKRFKKYIGQTFAVDFVGVKLNIKVVADEEVDMEFGTGAVGLTPAHSSVDFAIASKNKLPVIKIIDEQGKMADAAGPYAGLSVVEAREKIIANLKKVGLLEKEEEITHSIALCYRCDSVVEPLTSEQWFVDVNKKIPKYRKSLKEMAIEAVKKGFNGRLPIRIIPDRFTKSYFNWLENLHDWCISRQIWFGHQIPVWYKGKEIYVGVEAPKGVGWKQDEDTLDTWFSSGLWTFSTLGWPNETKDLKKYHPTSCLETAYDILFFWVARMILMTTYALGDIPFYNVYIHGMVCDKQGKKMSKSKPETCIDPMAVINKFGADVVRLSMLIGTTPGNNYSLYEEKIVGYRNFINKLWNISRFIITSVKKPAIIEKRPEAKTLADQWILSELDKIIDFTTKNIDNYKLAIVGEKLYEFTWTKLADYYLEIAKVEKDKDEILLYLLTQLLKLWHPFAPFITEHIWSDLLGNKKMLMISQWPKSEKSKPIKFELIEGIMATIRNRRIHGKIKSVKKPDAGQDKKKLEKEIKELENYIAGLKKKIGNKEFANKAPKVVVAKEKDKLVESEKKLNKLKLAK
ncbi:MAG: valine--tRNA ligase [bacterium]